jgi:hypothetical protein
MTEREIRIQALKKMADFERRSYKEEVNKLADFSLDNRLISSFLKLQFPCSNYSKNTPICWYPAAGLDFSLLAQEIGIPSDPQDIIKTFIFNDLSYSFWEEQGELANTCSLHYNYPDPDPFILGCPTIFLGFESMIHFHENGKVVIFVKADIRHLENELITHGIPIDLVAFLHAGILMDDAPRELARLGVKFYLGDPPYFEAKPDYQLLDIPDAPMFFLRDHQIPPLNYRIQKIQAV